MGLHGCFGRNRLIPNPAAMPPRQTSGQVRSAAEDEGQRQRLRRNRGQAFRESIEDIGVPEAEIETRVAAYRSQTEKEETTQESRLASLR